MAPIKMLTDYRAEDLIPANAMPMLFPGTNQQTWNALRHKGGGPAYHSVARRIYYRRQDVEAWLNGNRKVRTDLQA